MDPENIMLGEMSGRERQVLYVITYMWNLKNKTNDGTSLVVQCSRLCASNAGGTGSIPGWGTKISHAVQRGQKKKKKKKKKKNGYNKTETDSQI